MNRGPIDIVVPVYGAAAELARCLESLLATTPLGFDRLILVPDGQPDAGVAAVLERHRNDLAVGAFEIHPNPQRGGFVVAVERGLACAPERDAVLLNSDTEVTAGWLDKLASAAASAPRIATVTPLSNHATICSAPRAPVENALPAGYTVASFGALVERVALREYPRLPTGVGFCLFVRRAALTEVGGFDTERFGLGYGEEVDFCLRARRLGWEHVADDATFIYHAGHRSFGDARFARIAAGHRAIRRRFPGYLQEIDQFLRQDPLAPVRQRILEALSEEAGDHTPSIPLSPPPSNLLPGEGEAGRELPAPGPGDVPARSADLRELVRAPQPGPSRALAPRSVVHLVHGYPPWDIGGTELYAQGLVTAQRRHREVAVYARVGRPDRATGEAIEAFDHGVRIRRTVNNFTQRDPFARNGLFARGMALDFGRFLDDVRPELVHVHHLAGHAANLPREAHRRGLPLLFQLQDWWPLCARVNLTRPDNALCPGPQPDRCAACRPLTTAPLNRVLHLLRGRAFARALALADGFVAGSQFIVESYRAAGLLPADRPVWVRPYGVAASPLRPLASRAAVSQPVRFGFVGALMPHKGPHLLIEAMRRLPPGAATLTLWGDPEAAPEYAASLRQAAAGLPVQFAGAFAETDRGRVFTAMDLLVIPSIGLESFGLVAREAFAAGVPVVAVERGALPEIFAGAPAAGRLVAADDVAALAAALAEFAAEPERIDASRNALPAVRDHAEHAAEIETIYQQLLARRRTP